MKMLLVLAMVLPGLNGPATHQQTVLAEGYSPVIARSVPDTRGGPKDGYDLTDVSAESAATETVPISGAASLRGMASGGASGAATTLSPTSHTAKGGGSCKKSCPGDSCSITCGDGYLPSCGCLELGKNGWAHRWKAYCKCVRIR